MSNQPVSPPTTCQKQTPLSPTHFTLPAEGSTEPKKGRTPTNQTIHLETRILREEPAQTIPRQPACRFRRQQGFNACKMGTLAFSYPTSRNTKD
ncbi:hypothetical protein RESH_03296 [Rhodopirellula europaea SH398]|uniref:Uncharacterized protein n=1 Tax=Rhodopirellula europaea SH398 TaxID=1263868 RepID=M5S3N0_9BACT|nr:hypothetical protein RESH_03296 [Rhodopirellula europaea SH398]